MQILNCDNLINSCCSNYELVGLLSIFNNFLNLIHIIVPILLIVMASINLFQLMMNPKEEKDRKKVYNKFIAAVIVFFIPTIVNALLGMLPNNFELYGCLKEAQNISSSANSNESVYIKTNEDKRKKLINNPSDYEKGTKQETNNNQNNSTNTQNNTNKQNNSTNTQNNTNKQNSSTNTQNNTNKQNNSTNTQNNTNNQNNSTNTQNNTNKQNSSTNTQNNTNKQNNSTNTQNNTNKQNNSTNNNGSKGPVLLIAGHSYPPYCKQYSNECRGKSATSGYAEEDETRKLVKLIKKHLDSIGVNSDIANALMAGNTDQMNTSFFVESRKNSKVFNSYNWSKYSFVLEVHFNATSSSNGKGTLLCKKSSSYSTKADNDIVNAVIRHTGNKRLGDSIQTLNDVTYFTSRGIPIVYLETEFYDNKEAMKVYTNHMNEIAYDIAVAIKKHYG